MYRSNFVRKAVLEKNERSWTSVPASRNQSTKSEMRPTFQNIDYFKDETGSIIGMLTFSTDNPENFSLQFHFMIRRRKKISDSWILWNVPFRKEQSAHVKSETNLDDFLSSVILNS